MPSACAGCSVRWQLFWGHPCERCSLDAFRQYVDLVGVGHRTVKLQRIMPLHTAMCNCSLVHFLLNSGNGVTWYDMVLGSRSLQSLTFRFPCRHHLHLSRGIRLRYLLLGRSCGASDQTPDACFHFAHLGLRPSSRSKGLELTSNHPVAFEDRFSLCSLQRAKFEKSASEESLVSLVKTRRRHSC